MALRFGTPGAIRAVPPNAGSYGQGIAYPPDYDAAGRLILAAGERCVEDALRSIVETQLGERCMQADYGAGDFLFEPIDLARGKAAILRSIADHEPRIDPASVEIDAEPNPNDLGSVLVTIRYQLRGEATPRTLTYPDFVGPEA